MKKRIGIVNSGGDCAGINAVIASVVRSGVPRGYEFLGFEKGWEGILSPIKYYNLDLQAVNNISYLGGTILRTTNHGRFGAKVGEGQNARIPDEVLKEAKDHLDQLNVEGLIVIGGDGTLSGAAQLAELGVNIVGVPKTIDNDLSSTERTFGFSTAVGIAVDAIDKIQTTAHSHDRTIFVECMGRYAGWISLFAGLAGGADAILIPEFDFSVEKFIAYLRDRKKNDKYAATVVVAEGLRLDDRLIEQTYGRASEVTLSGVSLNLMKLVEKLAPNEFEMRNVVLGHIQRGGSPNSEDRILAKEYGVAAMDGYHNGEFNKVVCLRNGQMELVPIEKVVSALKLVTRDVKEYKTAKSLGVFMD